MKRLWTLFLRSLGGSRPWLQKKAPIQRNVGGVDSPGPDKVKMIIIPVFLSADGRVLTQVPVTPDMLCKDVLEFCGEAGGSSCQLIEVWRGNERVIPVERLMVEHLKKWGQRRQEVKFYLRHDDKNVRRPSVHVSRTMSRTDQSHQNQMATPRVELTLSELQEMAVRQQQQIEAHQQMLIAKEQRLLYLKQQDQGSSPCDQEKLQRLREKVENQEAKLKKVRAMRGQVDYSKLINGNLSVEIENVNTLFQEKQVELQQAVVKVEQLTQQLEDLRHKRITDSQPAGGAALELHKLYQELQMRNKLNQEQNTKLQQQKNMLNKRNLEVSMMDRRIDELRERLHRKKTELGRVSVPSSPQSVPVSSGRVAAVFPYIQTPSVTGRQDRGYSLTPDPLKPHLLTAQINHTRSRSDDDPPRKPSGPWKVSDLDIVVDREGPVRSTTNDANWNMGSVKAPDWKDLSQDPGKMTVGEKGSSKVLGTVTALSRHPSSIYGTYPSVGHHSTICATSSLPRSAPGTLAWHRPTGSSSQIQQRITVPPSPTSSAGSPVLPPAERTEPPLAAAVRPFVSDRGSRPQSPRKGPATMNSSSIYHVYLQQPAAKNYQSSSTRAAVKAVYGKPVLPNSSSSSPVSFQHQTSREDSERESESEMTPQASVENIPRPLSPTKLTPVAHSPLRYQSDIDLEVLRRKLANAPRPLKKRSSITEPEGPGGPNIQKLLYQRFNTLAGGIESVTPFFQPDAALGPPGDAHPANGNVAEESRRTEAQTSGPIVSQPVRSPVPDAREKKAEKTDRVETLITEPTDTKEEAQNNSQSLSDKNRKSAPVEKETAEQPGVTNTVKRTNLKKPGSERTGHGLRVKFNPLALLLDASLEGEFDLVQRIIYEVDNPSTPNDEGITPLHNSVCAGHYHIVKFLLDFGVNINAADSDGWTPLHCAASCNSVHLCKLLVESGAAVFATTISDVETPADKCEEMESGYIQCSQFLYGVQEKLGVMNKGAVYALWDYEARSPDELSFRDGDALTVLRRRDESETEWWWARLNEREGYVPRNLLGLYPRIKPRQRSLA